MDEWKNVKWLRVNWRISFDTNSWYVSGYYRDRSVPVEERKAYVVCYVLSRERIMDLGPPRAKAMRLKMKERAAEEVLKAARGLPSQATLKQELEMTPVTCWTE